MRFAGHRASRRRTPFDEATSITAGAGRDDQAPSAIWLVGDPPNARTLQPAGFEDVTSDIPFGLEPLTSSGSGRVWGAEAVVQKKLGQTPWYALASRTWSATSFTSLRGPAVRGAFAAPFIANLGGGWRPSARWECSGRLRAARGLPFTPFVAVGVAAGSLDFARLNAERCPDFFSVDLRADRRWTIGRRQLITDVELQNANALIIVNTYRWNARTRTVPTPTGLGLLPTIGVNWEF